MRRTKSYLCVVVCWGMDRRGDWKEALTWSIAVLLVVIGLFHLFSGLEVLEGEMHAGASVWHVPMGVGELAAAVVVYGVGIRYWRRTPVATDW